GAVAMASGKTVSPYYLSFRDAANYQRLGANLVAMGDLARAEMPLSRAAEICSNQLGTQHPATQTAVRELAEVYGAALNAPEASGLCTRPVTTPAVLPPPAPAIRPVSIDPPPQAPVMQTARRLRDRITRQPVHVVQASVVPVLVQGLNLTQKSE